MNDIVDSAVTPPAAPVNASEVDASSAVFEDIIDAMSRPQMIRLRTNLFCARFPLIKVVPARHIIRQALRSGALKPGGHVIETSSGTFAMALAMVCRIEGLRSTVICDPAIDETLKRRIEALGTRIFMVREPLAEGGYQGARLEVLAGMLEEDPKAYWPRQYHNPENRNAFLGVADEIQRTIGPPDILVGAVGSGGTMSGLSQFLRRRSPEMKAVAIDSYGSILFGQPDRKRLIRGAGSSIMFDNVVHESFDEIHWMTAGEAFFAAREFYSETAMFMGATSGAAVTVGRWLARNDPDRTVVAILPDEGHRYQSMFYDDEWIARQNVILTPPAPDPVEITHPRHGGPVWTRLNWGRRSYEAVTGEPRPRYMAGNWRRRQRPEVA
jgi:cysteine synthase A